MFNACRSTRNTRLKRFVSLSPISWILPILFLGLITSAHAQYQSFDIHYYNYGQFSSSDVASIDLYGTRGNMFAILIFLPIEDPNDLPAAAEGSDGVIRLYYQRERLDSVIDQLRNEAPLVLNFWTAPGDNSHIATKDVEPVGEGE